MRELREEAERVLPTFIPRPILARTIEHSCCEYSKFCRAREALATGRSPGLEVFRGGGNGAARKVKGSNGNGQLALF